MTRPRETHARFNLYNAKEAKDEQYFTNIPDLVQNVLEQDTKDPYDLVRWLNGESGTLELKKDNFLVLLGTTNELQRLRQALNDLEEEGDIQGGFDEILCAKGQKVGTWCVRVDVKKKGHLAAWFGQESTITMLVVGNGSDFTKVAGSDKPKSPWQPFPMVVSGGVPLDKTFDDAVAKAQKFTKV